MNEGTQMNKPASDTVKTKEPTLDEKGSSHRVQQG